jgi:hypothetical protein
MFFEKNVREGIVELRNCEQYLHVRIFRTMFSKFKKFRRGKNGEITVFADLKVHLI